MLDPPERAALKGRGPICVEDTTGDNEAEGPLRALVGYIQDARSGAGDKCRFRTPWVPSAWKPEQRIRTARYPSERGDVSQ